MTDTPIRPLSPQPEVEAFLAGRRSRPAKTLTTEAPDRETIRALLTTAARTPDHGKLEPWRFIVLSREGMERVAAAARTHGATLGMEPEQAAKAAANFTFGGAMIAVVASPKESPKIPAWEQELSAGAVCLALLNAALAAGWGANWLTGPFARDAGFLRATLGLDGHEFVAGFIHLGRETAVPPDRPRPDIDALTEWR